MSKQLCTNWGCNFTTHSDYAKFTFWNQQHDVAKIWKSVALHRGCTKFV